MGWRDKIPGPIGKDIRPSLTPTRTPGSFGINDSGDPNSPYSPVRAAAAPEIYWKGYLKGYLGENPVVYHTLTNNSDTPLNYLLRITNTGYCLLNLATQYENPTTGLDREWVALYNQHGKTDQVINGLDAHTTLHLRLFIERDATAPDQSYGEGTVEVILQ